MTETISRNNALFISAFAGFTGADRIYLGDYFVGFVQFCLLMLLFFADTFLLGEALVTLRVVLFGVIAVWWAWDVIRVGHKAALDGTAIHGSSDHVWGSPEGIEERAALVVALMFSFLVSVMPEWAPFHMNHIQA